MPAAVPVASDAAGPVYPRAHPRSPAPALVPGFRQFLSHICLRTRHGVLHYSRHPALSFHLRQRPPYSSPRVWHSDPARGGIWLALDIGTGMGETSIFASRLMSILYGLGAALTLDEFALWLNLKDVYWAKEGRSSIDAIVLFGALLAIGTWGAPLFTGSKSDKAVWYPEGNDERFSRVACRCARRC